MSPNNDVVPTCRPCKLLLQFALCEFAFTFLVYFLQLNIASAFYMLPYFELCVFHFFLNSYRGLTADKSPFDRILLCTLLFKILRIFVIPINREKFLNAIFKIANSVTQKPWVFCH